MSAERGPDVLAINGWPGYRKVFVGLAGAAMIYLALIFTLGHGSLHAEGEHGKESGHERPAEH